MDDVHAYDKRYAQSRLLDGNILQGTNLVDTLQIEDAAQLSAGNALSYLGVYRSACDNLVAGRYQVQLSQLLFQRHLR